jgi:hypothetical protein
VRGSTTRLRSNQTDAESTDSGYVTSFNSDGFSIGSHAAVNYNTSSFVGWAWDAGTSNTSISAGSLNSSTYDQSQTWSTGASTDGSNYNSTTSADAFDDTISTFWQTTDNATQTYAFTSLSSGTLEVYLHGNPSTYSIEVNGSAISSPTATTAAWVTFAANASTITSVDLVRTGTKVAVGGWRLNGKLLVDSGVTPTNAPSIVSTVRANPSAGFSIVSYTGTGASASVGHGLNIAPKIIIFKNRDASTNWRVYTTAVDGSMDSLFLNTTDAKVDSILAAFTSSVFYCGTNPDHNGNGQSMIAYCFAPVEGYSAMGSYTGSGFSDNRAPFVFLGFKPAFIMIKSTTLAHNWTIFDSTRGSFNVVDEILWPNKSNAEAAVDSGDTSTGDLDFDILSNGFKLHTANWSVNKGSSDTYVYLAFAEHPQKYSRAR